MKFFVILGINLFLLYCLALIFIDNKIFTKDPFAIVRNILLFAIAIWICYNVISIYVLQKNKQESGLVYKTASEIKAYGLAFYNYIQPCKKELGIWTLAAACFILLGFISAGLSGYIWLVIPEKLGLVKEITGDNAWPAAILMSVFWPLLLPIAVLIKHQLIKSGFASYAISGFWGAIVAGILVLITAIYLLNNKCE